MNPASAFVLSTLYSILFWISCQISFFVEALVGVFHYWKPNEQDTSFQSSFHLNFQKREIEENTKPSIDMKEEIISTETKSFSLSNSNLHDQIQSSKQLQLSISAPNGKQEASKQHPSRLQKEGTSFEISAKIGDVAKEGEEASQKKQRRRKKNPPKKKKEQQEENILVSTSTSGLASDSSLLSIVADTKALSNSTKEVEITKGKKRKNKSKNKKKLQKVAHWPVLLLLQF